MMSAPGNPDLVLKFLLYSLGGLGIITFLVTCWDGICDFFSSIFDLFPSNMFEEDREYERKRRRRKARRRRRRKWQILLPFMSKRRRKWLMESGRREADRKCRDIFAETLATHEDLIEAMYEQAPPMRAVYRNVKERYRV